MSTSIFLARLFGLYILILVAAMLMRREQFSLWVRELVVDSPALGLASLLTIIMGLLLVLSHGDVWVLGWEVVVTILCWWVLVKGCLVLFCPKIFVRPTGMMLKNVNYYYGIIIVDLILGLFLLYHGFFVQ